MRQHNVSPEQLALVVELLATAGSFRDIAAMTGLRLDAVRAAAAPFLAIMKLTGTHPQCGCGRDRFHPYGCVDSYVKSGRNGEMPGRTVTEAEELTGIRLRAIEMIKAGDRWKHIDAAIGRSKGCARKYLRFMTAEDVAARTALDATRRDSLRRESKGGRAKRPKAPVFAPTPIRDALYLRIAAAVPRWPSPALRDDIISEIYLAVLDGSLREDDVVSSAKVYASRVSLRLENSRATRSLDEPLFADTAFTLLDTLKADAPADTDVFDEDFRIGQSIRSPHRASVRPRGDVRFNLGLAA
ncbi:MAG: hypothetical protein JWL91_337 [Sphingomonas bacterium]|nr:hypothetical protein [Sphingomonas bacterium]MDB5688461.1 hypothetical protein [Sphingomonas bacterium]